MKNAHNGKMTVVSIIHLLFSIILLITICSIWIVSTSMIARAEGNNVTTIFVVKNLMYAFIAFGLVGGLAAIVFSIICIALSADKKANKDKVFSYLSLVYVFETLLCLILAGNTIAYTTIYNEIVKKTGDGTLLTISPVQYVSIGIAAVTIILFLASAATKLFSKDNKLPLKILVAALLVGIIYRVSSLVVSIMEGGNVGIYFSFILGAMLDCFIITIIAGIIKADDKEEVKPVSEDKSSLEKLQDLRNQGILTAEEYEEKRKALMDK